jgi:hypothetical protein
MQSACTAAPMLGINSCAWLGRSNLGLAPAEAGMVEGYSTSRGPKENHHFAMVVFFWSG